MKHKEFIYFFKSIVKFFIELQRNYYIYLNILRSIELINHHKKYNLKKGEIEEIWKTIFKLRIYILNILLRVYIFKSV